MTVKKMPDGIGLAIWIDDNRAYNGPTRVCVRVMRRDAQCEHPCGGPEWYSHESLYLVDGLGMDARIYSDIGPSYDRPTFLHSYTWRDIDLYRAEAMVATLKRVQLALAKEQASEPGDVIRTLASVIGASFVCHPGGGDSPYQQTRGATSWVWHTYNVLASARDTYRALIAHASDLVKAREENKLAA